MRHPLRKPGLVFAAAVLLATAACSGEAIRDDRGDADGIPQARSTRGTGLGGDPKMRPALAFETKAAHSIPIGPMEQPPVSLYGRAVWIADEAGLTAVDVRNGKTVTRVEPTNTPLYKAASPTRLTKSDGQALQYRVLPPQVGRVRGEPAVLAIVPVELEPRDGGAPQHGFEVIAVRADDGKVIWRLPVEIDGEPEGRLGGSVWRPPYDGMAAVQWTVNGGLRGTFAIALDRPRVLWQRTDFEVIDGYHDALVGFRDNGGDTYTVAGASLSDGRDLWNISELTGTVSAGGRYDAGYSGGPWSVVADDGHDSRLVEIATGDTALTEQTGLKADMDCGMREGGSAVLCASKQDGALALDAGTGEVLWQRPPGDGSTEWSGTVSTITKDYAYVDRADGPVVIDIRSGKVVGADPGIVPDRANAYAGLVFTGTNVEIHLSRGEE
jgi:outer membrane protein assembly factor BamB